MKHFDYPVSTFEMTPERETLSAATAELRKHQQDLSFATKMAKRSPAKWTPIIADRQALVDTYTAVVANCQAAVDEQKDAADHARSDIFDAAVDEILRSLGCEPFALNHATAGRIRVADQPYDVMVYTSGYDRPSFEVELVNQGTFERVFGFSADVRGPRSGFRDETVVPAYVSWGSYSGMDTIAKAELMMTVHHIAIMVATATNEVFGL